VLGTAELIPWSGEQGVAGKSDRPEEIVAKLQQVEVLQWQGIPVANALHQTGVT
jgi:hypothetical protein